MSNNSLISIKLLNICLKYKFIIFRNVLLVMILVSILSLIMPKTFRSTAVLMPPKSQSDSGLISNKGEISLGSLLTGSTDGSNAIFAILKSRTMAESVINEMNLIEIYGSENLEEAIKTFKKNLIIRDLEEGTISLSILVHTPWLSNDMNNNSARKLSTKIVRYIIIELDRVNKLLQTDEARYQRLFLEKRHNETINNLNKAEEELRLFQHKHNTLDLVEQTKAAINIGAEIQSQILIEEVKLGVLSKTYNSDHPEIVKLEMQIEELDRQLSVLDIGSNQFTDSNDKVFPKYSEVPDLSIELMRLQREVEIQSTLYLYLSERYEASKIQEARDTPTIQVLDDANSPIKRYKPKRKLMVIGYALISMALSIFYVILIDYRQLK